MKVRDKIKKAHKVLEKMYQEAQCTLPEHLSWNQIMEVCKLYYNDNHKQLQTPYDAYSLFEDRQKEILKEATKYTRSSWNWYRKPKIGENGWIPDPEWDEYKSQLDKLRRKALRKEIAWKDIKKWQESVSDKYPLQKRYYDREDIQFYIINYAPRYDNPKTLEESEELQRFWKAWMTYEDQIKEL